MGFYAFNGKDSRERTGKHWVGRGEWDRQRTARQESNRCILIINLLFFYYETEFFYLPTAITDCLIFVASLNYQIVSLSI